MGKTYTTAPAALAKHVQETMERFHPELAKYEVTATLLCVSAARDENGMAKGPALLLHGYPCRATIKINSLKDRAAGLGDCTITFDGDEWENWTEPELIAVIDHELMHIELKGEDGETDDAGRPKLKMRLHDFDHGGFEEVAKRHRENATEWQAFAKTAKWFQQSFQWG